MIDINTHRERRLLLDAPQVRATLDRQTCTKRIAIASRTCRVDGSGRLAEHLDLAADSVFVDRGPSPAGNSGPYLHVPSRRGDTTHRVYPVWQLGDRLWMAETFALENTEEYAGEQNILPNGGRPLRAFDDGEGGTYHLIPRYRATEPETLLMVVAAETPEECMRWSPATQMPRWASRMLLTVMGVDVERLQDIS